jgi:hypothetical protein
VKTMASNQVQGGDFVLCIGGLVGTGNFLLPMHSYRPSLAETPGGNQDFRHLPCGPPDRAIK